MQDVSLHLVKVDSKASKSEGASSHGRAIDMMCSLRRCTDGTEDRALLFIAMIVDCPKSPWGR